MTINYGRSRIVRDEARLTRTIKCMRHRGEPAGKMVRCDGKLSALTMRYLQLQRSSYQTSSTQKLLPEMQKTTVRSGHESMVRADPELRYEFHPDVRDPEMETHTQREDRISYHHRRGALTSSSTFVKSLNTKTHPRRTCGHGRQCVIGICRNLPSTWHLFSVTSSWKESRGSLTKNHGTCQPCVRTWWIPSE